MRIKVTKVKGSHYQLPSITQFINALIDAVGGLDKIIVKCIDGSGKTIAMGFIRKIDVANKLLYLTIHEKCEYFEFEIVQDSKKSISQDSKA